MTGDVAACFSSVGGGRGERERERKKEVPVGRVWERDWLREEKKEKVEESFEEEGESGLPGFVEGVVAFEVEGVEVVEAVGLDVARRDICGRWEDIVADVVCS